MACCAAWASLISTKAISATATWMRTAFSNVPKKWHSFGVCLTQRKNNSVAQRLL